MKKTIAILSSVASIFLLSCNNNTPDSQSTGTEKDSVQTVATNFKSPKPSVTVEEAFELSKEGAVIIDVRQPEELEEIAYDVKNIIHIPLGELESRLAEVPKDKQVIVACRSGKRSGKAYDILNENGFTNIANMEGGILEWQEKGLPTITGGEKKACCSNPNSKDCNPDGTCKKPSDKK